MAWLCLYVNTVQRKVYLLQPILINWQVPENYISAQSQRGTNPDPKLSPKTIEGLHRDGLAPAELAPQKLTLADLESAEQIILFVNYQKNMGKEPSMQPGMTFRP